VATNKRAERLRQVARFGHEHLKKIPFRSTPIKQKGFSEVSLSRYQSKVGLIGKDCTVEKGSGSGYSDESKDE
jgi:hypothetical protein